MSEIEKSEAERRFEERVAEIKNDFRREQTVLLGMAIEFWKQRLALANRLNKHHGEAAKDVTTWSEDGLKWHASCVEMSVRMREMAEATILHLENAVVVERQMLEGVRPDQEFCIQGYQQAVKAAELERDYALHLFEQRKAELAAFTFWSDDEGTADNN